MKHSSQKYTFKLSGFLQHSVFTWTAWTCSEICIGKSFAFMLNHWSRGLTIKITVFTCENLTNKCKCGCTLRQCFSWSWKNFPDFIMWKRPTYFVFWMLVSCIIYLRYIYDQLARKENQMVLEQNKGIMTKLCLLKGSPKNENSVINYSPSCRSKP